MNVTDLESTVNLILKSVSIATNILNFGINVEDSHINYLSKEYLPATFCDSTQLKNKDI